MTFTIPMYSASKLQVRCLGVSDEMKQCKKLPHNVNCNVLSKIKSEYQRSGRK